MKILIICSKKFYDRIPEIKRNLENKGHGVELPNCFEDSGTEDRKRELGATEHARFKKEMFEKSAKTISEVDAVLVLNFDKNGVKNYIGGATFLEMYDAFRFGKKIFMFNEPPEGILADEINGFSPLILAGDLDKIA